MSGSIARKIDHSLLQPTLTDGELRAGCELARRFQVASVCLKPYAVPLASELLEGSGVAVGTVVGFPHGSHATRVKVFEAEQACRDGATELDMVVNIGKVLSGEWAYVRAEIGAIVDLAHAHGAISKVIFENDFLPGDDLKIHLCRLAEEAGAEFVKTSTGYGFTIQPDGHYAYRGATEHDVRLMRAHVGPEVQVKAAGGIRTYEDALRMCRAGAARLGCTATEAIVSGERLAQGIGQE
jgi:deoxyribose-phosphate aldolase